MRDVRQPVAILSLSARCSFFQPHSSGSMARYVQYPPSIKQQRAHVFFPQYTFVGNFVLKDKYIYNIRRSGPIAETFVFEVDFTTTFEKLQELREKMLAFLKQNGRDYLQVFDGL